MLAVHLGLGLGFAVDRGQALVQALELEALVHAGGGGPVHGAHTHTAVSSPQSAAACLRHGEVLRGAGRVAIARGWAAAAAEQGAALGVCTRSGPDLILPAASAAHTAARCAAGTPPISMLCRPAPSGCSEGRRGAASSQSVPKYSTRAGSAAATAAAVRARCALSSTNMARVSSLIAKPLSSCFWPLLWGEAAHASSSTVKE